MTSSGDTESAIVAGMSALRFSATRTQLQLATLSTVAPIAEQRLLMEWFDGVASHTGAEFRRLDVGVSFTTDLAEVAWWIAGPAEVLLASLTDVFDELGVSQSARARFEQIGLTLMPATVGTSLQVGAAGTDAAWHVPEHVSSAELEELDLPAGLHDALGRPDAGAVVQLEGGLGPVAYVGATSRLAVTGEDRARQLASVYTTAAHRPPPGALLVALTELHDGELLRSDWFNDGGRVKLSVLAMEPSVATMLAVSTASAGAPDESLAEVMATLGASRPHAMEVESWADGVRARVHVNVVQPA